MDDIFYDPKHPYTWALLSSMPSLDTKEKLEAIPGTPPNMIYPPKGDAFADRNKYAMKIDFEKEPPFFKVSDTHYAATWLLHPDAPKVDPPKSVTEKQENENILEVRHLKQYFGKNDFKAVDDVSFTVKKGEVVGIVGESGCGKTTTGRSIIKLYNATSGDVYFKGQRIVAGTRSYTDAIAAERKASKERVEAMKKAGNTAGIKEEKEHLKAFVEEQKRLIREAKNDHKNCIPLYRERLAKEINEEYDEKERAAAGDSAKLAELKKERHEKLKDASKENIVTRIQMIFQDPIASLDPRMTIREIIAA